MNPNPPAQLLLSPEDYRHARELILARTGLSFDRKRHNALARALNAGAQRHGCATLRQYLDRLERAPTNSETWDHLVESLTVGETYFFRDPEQIEALRSTILPGLVAAHRADRTLRLWSAGCATGEEPYTLAILLQQILPDIGQWKITILATDINKWALRQAALACYRPWSFRQTDPALRQAYFDQRNGCFELRPHLRQRVTFAYLNLVEANYPSADNHTANLDLILWRNVSIYLPATVSAAILHRFHQCLAPGGWLMLGASETHPDLETRFQLVQLKGALAYRKAVEPLPKLENPSMDDAPANHTQDRLPGVGAAGDVMPAAAFAGEDWCMDHCPVDALAGRALAGRASGREDEPDQRQRVEACLARDPHCVRALCYMAESAADAGCPGEARRWAQRVLDLDPLHAGAHYLLAMLHEEQDEYEQAVARLKKVLFLSPDFVLAHFRLSNLYQRLGQSERAARHRTIAIRMAAGIASDAVLPGSGDPTVGRRLDQSEGNTR